MGTVGALQIGAGDPGWCVALVCDTEPGVTGTPGTPTDHDGEMEKGVFEPQTH